MSKEKSPLMLLEELSPQAATAADPAYRILLVDDDRKLVRLLTNFLAPHGYAVTAVHDGISAVERVNHGDWQLVMLDVMLPGLDGFEVLKRIRTNSSVPVLMLTARGEEADRIVGLEIGADDYVPKEYSSRELLARIRALLRRSQGMQREPTPGHHLTVGNLRILLDSHRVFVSDSELVLTLVEFNLLASLVRCKGTVRTRAQLLSEAHETVSTLNERSIDVHISMLRRKLGDAGSMSIQIRTVRSIGYMLVDPAAPAP